MLRATSVRPRFWRTGRLAAAVALGAFCWANVLDRAAFARWPTRFPLLAQDTSSEGGYPILEWAIVIVLIGAALFVICRSSRRN